MEGGNDELSKLEIDIELHILLGKECNNADSPWLYAPWYIRFLLIYSVNKLTQNFIHKADM